MRKTFDQATLGAPPHLTLLNALEHWQQPPGRALDLGCGMGRDTLELLRQNWQVCAIDQRQAALDGLSAQVSPLHANNLQLLCADFSQCSLAQVELINASFAIPFCPKAAFASFWQRLEQALVSRGLFAGHFFGIHDDWQEQDLILHEAHSLERLFSDWQLLQFAEQRWDGKTAMGHSKHWHLFSVVARRF